MERPHSRSAGPMGKAKTAEKRGGLAADMQIFDDSRHIVTEADAFMIKNIQFYIKIF